MLYPKDLKAILEASDIETGKTPYKALNANFFAEGYVLRGLNYRASPHRLERPGQTVVNTSDPVVSKHRHYTIFRPIIDTKMPFWLINSKFLRQQNAFHLMRFDGIPSPRNSREFQAFAVALVNRNR